MDWVLPKSLGRSQSDIGFRPFATDSTLNELGQISSLTLPITHSITWADSWLTRMPAAQGPASTRGVLVVILRLALARKGYRLKFSQECFETFQLDAEALIRAVLQLPEIESVSVVRMREEPSTR
jgi:hypothetical protein